MREPIKPPPGETTVYVKLLDEGTDVWRPALAADLGDAQFRLIEPPDYDPSSEAWEFSPGSTVECEPRTLSGGVVLVATRLVTE